MIVLDLSGKITLGNGDQELVAEITALLDPATPRHLLLNLDRVPYMDSAAVGALVTCYRRAKEANSTIKLLNPTKRVYDLLQVVKLDSIFESFTDEERALESFPQA